MPTIDETRRPWDRYNRSRGGNECPDASRNPAAQRHGMLLARLVSLAADQGSPRNSPAFAR